MFLIVIPDSRRPHIECGVEGMTPLWVIEITTSLSPRKNSLKRIVEFETINSLIFRIQKINPVRFRVIKRGSAMVLKESQKGLDNTAQSG